MSTLHGRKRTVCRTFATCSCWPTQRYPFRPLSAVFDVGEAILGWQVVERPPSEYRNVARHNRLLSPRIPPDMNEVRDPEYTNSLGVLVTAKGDEVKGGRTGSHTRSREWIRHVIRLSGRRRHMIRKVTRFQFGADSLSQHLQGLRPL